MRASIVEHGLVRAAVQRAVERVDARRDRREQVGPGRADEAHGRGRRVLLVVFVQDEQPLERRDEHRVDLVELGQDAEVELEEVVDEAQRVVGVEERLADALLVRVRGDHRQLREQADRVELDVLGVVRVGLSPRSRSRAPRPRDESTDIGCAVCGSAEKKRLRSSCSRVWRRMLLVELGELVGGGQLAVDEQPGDLEVGASARRAARSGSRGSAGCPASPSM